MRWKTGREIYLGPKRRIAFIYGHVHSVYSKIKPSLQYIQCSSEIGHIADFS